MEIPRTMLLCLVIALGPAGLRAAEDGAALAQTIDEVITAQRFLDDIPGAAVAVVRGARELHVRGYGLADRETQHPVDAGRTLFGAGSVAKVFTWTAVMQLVEQGRLVLDGDINAYLGDFQVPASWPDPVTLAHLMTHTAGFEDRNIGFYARDPADLLPLGEFLARHMPARVYPPGTVSAYSNYGAALAGHIVAVVSGMPFEQYIEEHILAPLGMQHSSFRQPLPVALAAGEARGYRGPEGHAGRSFYQARPSGALRTTAVDMARFMIANLQRGRLGETRLFNPETAAAMQQRQFSNHPAVNGLTYGFQELTRHGLRVLWQRGDTLYFTAGVFLVPELDLGVFVAYNRARVGHAPLELLDAILARLQPPQPPQQPRPAMAGAAATDRLTGDYRSTRSNSSGIEKLLKPFRPVRVRAQAPGMLSISGLAMGGDTLWVEAGPLRYQAVDSDEFVVFRVDGGSGPVYLFEGNMPVAAYYRLAWHAGLPLHAGLLALCALVFVATLLIVPWQLRRRVSAGDLAQPLRRAAQAAAGMSAVNLVLIAALWLVMGVVVQLLFGIPPLVRVALLLPWISLLVTGLTFGLLLRAWLVHAGSLVERIRLVPVMVAGCLFQGQLFYWQLL